MLVALFIGTHRKDGLMVRLGWALTRLAQKGEYANVTHCEAILGRNADGTASIASSSLRDGGVRTKRAVLDPANWLVVNVPMWDAAKAAAWFSDHAGQKYDWRGAWALFMPGREMANRWFCDAAILAAVGWKAPASFGPAQFAAVCLSLGRDVTQEFFNTTP